MSGKIYHVQDLNALRIGHEYVETEQTEINSFAGKSIFAPKHFDFDKILTRRTQSKKLPKIPFGARRGTGKDLSVPLPNISKEQGSIANYLQLKIPPKVFNNSPRIRHRYFKERLLRKIDVKPTELSCLTTRGYKLNNHYN